MIKLWERIPEGFGHIKTFKKNPLKNISFSLLRIKGEVFYSFSTLKKEAVLLPLCGEFIIIVDGKEFKMQREDFLQKPCALYIPVAQRYDIVYGEGELAICEVKPKEKNTSIFFIDRENIIEKKVGEENYFRIVRDIITPSMPSAALLGETLSCRGNWSSFPPHCHDAEELYFFKVKPPSGFGMQRIYKDDFDICIPLCNNTVVAIPFGYHPVVGAPFCTLYYLWIIASKKIELKYDPSFS